MPSSSRTAQSEPEEDAAAHERAAADRSLWRRRPGSFNFETEHLCNLIRAGKRESPENPPELSRGMARLLEAARAELGVQFIGDSRDSYEVSIG